MDRDCENCKHYKIVNGISSCESWKCEFEPKEKTMIEIEKIDTAKAAKEQAERLEVYQKKLQKEAEAEGQKSVPQILGDIADRFCDNYCKYPEIWDEEKEGCELCESDICVKCPINRLT